MSDQELSKPRPSLQISAPGWVTSFGALVALLMAALSYSSLQGEQKEAQRRTDMAGQLIEQRVSDGQRRLWDAQTDLRKEIRADLQREIERACRCANGNTSP